MKTMITITDIVSWEEKYLPKFLEAAHRVLPAIQRNVSDDWKIRDRIWKVDHYTWKTLSDWHPDSRHAIREASLLMTWFMVTIEAGVYPADDFLWNRLQEFTTKYGQQFGRADGLWTIQLHVDIQTVLDRWELYDGARIDARTAVCIAMSAALAAPACEALNRLMKMQNRSLAEITAACDRIDLFGVSLGGEYHGLLESV